MKGRGARPLRLDADALSLTRFQVRVTFAELDQWRAAAEARNVTLSNLVRQAVKEVLARTHVVDPRREHKRATGRKGKRQ